MFKRYWWILLVMIPVGMVAGLFLARVHLHLIPRVYESEVIVEIKFHPSSEETIEPAATHQYMVRPLISFPAEFEPLKSRTILSKVSQHLKLEASWEVDEDTVVARLKDAVQVMVIKGTDLKRVKVRSTDPVEARDIARELAAAYREWSRELEKEMNDSMLTELRRVVQEQEDQVEEARKELESIMKIKSIETSVNDGDVVEATKKFEQKSDTFEQMKLKLRSEEIDSSMIETWIVVHDEPVLSNKPVGLDERLIMLIWMAGGALISPLFALPIMAFLNHRKRPEMG